MNAWSPALLKPLANRDFRRVWLGECASQIGGGIQVVILAALVLQLTNSTVALSAMLIVSGVPRAVLMIVGGVLSDRISPRLIVMGSYCCRALVMGGLALLAATHELAVWQIFVGRFLLGVGDSMFYPAISALVPRTVSKPELLKANALHRMVLSAGVVVGPGIAGVLLGVSGNQTSLFIASASYLVAMVILLPVRERAIDPSTAKKAKKGMWHEAMAGLRYTLRSASARWIIGLLAVLNLVLVGPVNVGIPALATERFGDAAYMGMLFAVLGAGSLAGSVVAGLIEAPRRPGVLLALMAALNGAAVVLMGVAPQVWIAAIASALIGLSAAIVNVVVPMVLQMTVEPAYLGRVMSWYSLTEFGVGPLSNVGVGFMVAASIAFTFVGTGGIAVIVSLIALAAPALRGLRGTSIEETVEPVAEQTVLSP